jgi:hypothetical protein
MQQDDKYEEDCLKEEGASVPAVMVLLLGEQNNGGAGLCCILWIQEKERKATRAINRFACRSIIARAGLAILESSWVQLELY